MEKLNRLAKAAAEYYEVPFRKLKSPCREAVCTIPRHVCQWVAVDAGYKKSEIARYWGLDRTAVYYGVKVVSARIKSNKHEKAELKGFLRFLRVHL
jgi:chromosomal replication initiation ATPase DnaA